MTSSTLKRERVRYTAGLAASVAWGSFLPQKEDAGTTPRLFSSRKPPLGCRRTAWHGTACQAVGEHDKSRVVRLALPLPYFVSIAVP